MLDGLSVIWSMYCMFSMVFARCHCLDMQLQGLKGKAVSQRGMVPRERLHQGPLVKKLHGEGQKLFDTSRCIVVE